MTYAFILGTFGMFGLIFMVGDAIKKHSDGIDRTSKVEQHDMPQKPAGYVSPKGGR